MKGILKWPLIVAAAVVALRVITERAGAPPLLNSMLSVAALTTVLAPVYFGIQLGLAGNPRPYWMLIKLVGIYVVCARAMVLPTYWAARIYNWTEPRFAGLNHPDPMVGFVSLPLLTAGFWIAGSLAVGGVSGAIALAIVRARTRKA